MRREIIVATCIKHSRALRLAALLLTGVVGMAARTLQEGELWPPDPSNPFVEMGADLTVRDDPPPHLVNDDDPDEPDLSETPDDVAGLVLTLDP